MPGFRRTLAWGMLASVFFVADGHARRQTTPSSSSPAPSDADWPQWRGANRDGSIGNFKPPAQWPEQLTRRWKVDVGLGYATPVLVGARIYMFARQGDNESMTALDAGTGATLWRTSYPAVFTMNSGAAQHGPGPKSTPAYFDGKVFAIGMTGMVTAFDAATGRILWQRPGTGVVPMFTTYAFAPLVDRGNPFFTWAVTTTARSRRST